MQPNFNQSHSRNKMSTEKRKIIYTKTDEAPALATYSLLPIISAFARPAEIDVEPIDISLSARVLSLFPEYLPKDKQVPDNLKALGQLTLRPEANIIKLPRSEERRVGKECRYKRKQ